MSDINSILPDYYRQKIAVVGKRSFFIKFRDALVDCIRQYGFEANAYAEVEDALSDDPTCVVVINPMLYPMPRNRSILWIMINTEQLFNGENRSEQIMFKNNIRKLKPYLKAYDVILESSKANICGLKRITRANILHFVYGWYPSLEQELDQCIESNQKEYDLLFLGNMPGVDSRRKRLLEFLSTKYKVYPIRNDLWNEKKAQALRSARICLNIHYDESRYMERGRLDDYFANQCFVLSEPMYNTEPYVEGEDYIEFYWTNLCEKIDYYLIHEEERRRIAENAYKKIHENTLMDSVRIVIDSVILESYNRYRIDKDKDNNSPIKKLKRLVKRILLKNPMMNKKY